MFAYAAKKGTEKSGAPITFENNLLFLIPFYIFSHEKRFSEYDTDGEKLESLKAEYMMIMDRLDNLQKEG